MSTSSAVPAHARVLIVEDDEDIGRLLAHAVTKAGLTAELLQSGADAVRRVRADPPDVLLLDVMLPGVDGRDV